MKGFGMLSIDQAGWIEKQRPECGGLDAIIHPIVLAPCSSDTHVLHGGFGEHKNLILGHEAVGEIVEVGNLVKNFKVGDIVVVPCTTPNWLAENVQGEYNAHDEGLMKSFKFLGSKDGTFAEYFHVNQADANLVLLPENVLPEAALMTVDMMSTGFHGVENANVRFGDKVVVIGIGPVGLMAVAGAKLHGAGQLIAIGTRPNCVKIAKEYGATDIVSYKDGDIVKQVFELTKGGADSVIIAGGSADILRQAVEMTVPGGYISNVNFFDAQDVLSMPTFSWGLGMSDKTIRGGFCPGGARRIRKMLNMVEHGRIDTTKLITHRYNGLSKIEDAFYLMDQKPNDLIKPIVFID